MFKAFKQVNDEILHDEDQFIDRRTLRVFVVDETRTDLGKQRRRRNRRVARCSEQAECPHARCGR
jgi:hypothetical protein